MQSPSRIRLFGAVLVASLIVLSLVSPFSPLNLYGPSRAIVSSPSNEESSGKHVSDTQPLHGFSSIGDKIVVIGHRSSEDMSWVAENLPE